MTVLPSRLTHPSRSQLAAADAVKAQHRFVREHLERQPPFRLFVFIDDGVSIGGIDGITHEVQIRPDGAVSGLPEEDDDMLDFDPRTAGGGVPCAKCGREQEPWRFSDLCQACIWDGANA